MKRLVLTKEALRALDRMPVNDSVRIRAKLAQYIVEPKTLSRNVRALCGTKDLLRLRVGNWRVLFTDAGQVVQIVKIAPRSSAYDEL